MAALGEKTCGIIGGMGPEATIDLMQRIVRLTPALDDSDHVRCLVDNNPKVPSRIRALIHGDGEDPGPHLAGMARNLEAWGADFLVIACNTAHHYYPVIRDAVRIPVIHLIGLTAARAAHAFPEALAMGVLGSPAIKDTGLYAQAFAPLGIELIWPEPPFQAVLLDLIRAVKGGHTGPDIQKEFFRICDHLKTLGGEPAIIACTELSILNTLAGTLPIEHIDAADILAKEVVTAAKSRLPVATWAP